MKLKLVLLILSVAGIPGAGAAILPVENLFDNGAGSLREALANARDGDLIDATGLRGSVLLTSGELSVTHSVTVIGSGPANLALDGNSASRVFHIGSNTVVTIAGITISNGVAADYFKNWGGGIYNEGGTLTVSNCFIVGNAAAAVVGSGGAIANDALSLGNATVRLVESTLARNSAAAGGAILNFGGAVHIERCVLRNNGATNGLGGAIYNRAYSNTALCEITNSTLKDNSADSEGLGGSIFNGAIGLDSSAWIRMTNCTLNDNSAKEGGAIENVSYNYGCSRVEIFQSALKGNRAISGGAIHNLPSSHGQGTVVVVESALGSNTAASGGGAIYSKELGGAAAVQLIRTTIDSNAALGGSGGGIYNDHGRLTLTKCTVSKNSAGTAYPQAGGGVCNSGGSLEIRDSTFMDNSADLGGALSNDRLGTNTATVLRCYIGGNKAYRYGGGIYNAARLQLFDCGLEGNTAYDYVGFSFRVGGGAVFNGATAALQVVRCTLNGNVATGTYGGALMNEGDALILGSTLSGNYSGYGAGFFNAGSARILNSTLTENSALFSGSALEQAGAWLQIGGTILNGAGENVHTVPGSSLVSLGYNLSSDNGGGFLTQPTDLIQTDPLLGPLADNGGVTLTHALRCGSPAIDRGTNFSASLHDQRGLAFARTFDDIFAANAAGSDGTDIGAFEVQESCLSPDQKVRELLVALAAKWSRPRSLQAILEAVAASIERNDRNATIHQLEAFRRQVVFQVAPVDSSLAWFLEQAALEITADFSPARR